MGKPERRKQPTNYREMVSAIEATGCSIVMTSSGHHRVVRPNGTFVIAIPSTTANFRAYRNAWVRFLRALGPLPSLAPPVPAPAPLKPTLVLPQAPQAQPSPPPQPATPSEAEMPPNPNGNRIAFEELDNVEFLREAAKTETHESLARKLGVSKDTIRRRCAEHGLHRRGWSKVTPEMAAGMAVYYQQGWTCGEIGTLFDVHSSTVGEILRENGVTLRPPGRPTAR